MNADREITAINEVVLALEPLDATMRARVLRYINDRYARATGGPVPTIRLRTDP